MRLVHGDEGDIDVLKKFDVFLFGERLRGDVEQLGFTCHDVRLYFLHLHPGEGGVEEVGYFVFVAVTPDAVHLVFHQGDER
jgi:hypothetical protein